MRDHRSYWVLGSQRNFYEFPFGIQYVQSTADGIRLHLESNASLDSLLSGLLPGRVRVGTGDDETTASMGAGSQHEASAASNSAASDSPPASGSQAPPDAPSRRPKPRSPTASATTEARPAGSPATPGPPTNAGGKTSASQCPTNPRRDAAWLPSGLLRRLGLLHTVAVPQVATGHEARPGEWWILKLDHDGDTALRRAELVQALTDPEERLGLAGEAAGLERVARDLAGCGADDAAREVPGFGEPVKCSSPSSKVMRVAAPCSAASPEWAAGEGRPKLVAGGRGPDGRPAEELEEVARAGGAAEDLTVHADRASALGVRRVDGQCTVRVRNAR
ncbi:hypothetical protein WDV06_23435 [Streptomyces racemochromogenes]|uniref:Uncharacterized protein n=1 Tax=Streptomyces racemochromogenes TaxID=67353 RepID=A0ABW7PI05_9ACTN